MIKKWRLAGHTARRTDGRWSEKALHWEPESGKRAVGHPRKRWAEEIAAFHNKIFGNKAWSATAQNREQ
eukprot:400157-Karenia_brevis.AAC.1